MPSIDSARSVPALFKSLVAQPLARFFAGLQQSDRRTLYVMLATAVVLGFLIAAVFTGNRATAYRDG